MRGRVDGTEVQVVEGEECGGIGEREKRKMDSFPFVEVEVERNRGEGGWDPAEVVGRTAGTERMGRKMLERRWSVRLVRWEGSVESVVREETRESKNTGDACQERRNQLRLDATPVSDTTHSSLAP